MANETRITVVGNLTADPDLTTTTSGATVVNITIASTPRHFDKNAGEWKDGDTLFLRATAWRDLADHIAASLSRGVRVIATGYLKQRSYTTRDGDERTVIELELEEIGPSLAFATAQITRARQGDQRTQAAARPVRDDRPYPPRLPHTEPGQSEYDETPF